MILQHAIKTNQVAVQIVDRLIFRRFFAKEHLGSTGKHLAICFVLWNHFNYCLRSVFCFDLDIDLLVKMLYKIGIIKKIVAPRFTRAVSI